jgi:hypothetical protein
MTQNVNPKHQLLSDSGLRAKLQEAVLLIRSLFSDRCNHSNVSPAGFWFGSGLAVHEVCSGTSKFLKETA